MSDDLIGTITLTNELGEATSSVRLVRNPGVFRGSPPQVLITFTDYEDDQEPFVMRANAAELRVIGERFLRSATRLEREERG